MKTIYENQPKITNKKENKRKKINSKSLGFKLAVSLAILSGAVLLRINLPGVYRDVFDEMSKSVDFVSAFNAVESGLSGETEMKEAFEEACRYVFIGSDDEKIQVINLGEYFENLKN